MRTAVLLSCLAVAGSCAASVPVAANWDFWIFSRQVTLDGAVRNSWPAGSSFEELRGRYAPTREGARTYLDDILRGGITHFVMNVNCQRTLFDSKTFEPVWADGFRAGMREEDVVATALALKRNGVDLYAVWCARCREKDVSPWLSFRMNDMHQADVEGCPSISTFWRSHPEFRRFPEAPSGHWFWESQSLDWAHAEVRERMRAFIAECLERYDADGIELDFTRFQWYFRPGEERKNAPLMTAFVREVRRLADAAAARTGHPVRIAGRFLADPDTEAALGLDAGLWGREGLIDYVDAGCHFSTIDMRIPVSKWKAATGGRVKVFPHADCGISQEGAVGWEMPGRRLLTREEYLGWADVMLAAGADGLGLYNLFGFSHKSEVWNETVTRGFERELIARSPRAYPVSYRDAVYPDDAPNPYPRILPVGLDRPFACSVPVGTVPAAGAAEAVLGFEKEVRGLPEVRVNGTACAEGRPAEVAGCAFARAFDVPLSAVRAGENGISVGAADGAKIVYLALRLKGKERNDGK